MSAPARVVRSFPRASGKLERHWILVGPDGVLTLCAVETSEDMGFVWVDGAWWASWGIDAHIPAHRCAGTCECHDVDSCGLLDGVRCCIAGTAGIDAYPLLRGWAAGADDELIWADLESRYGWMVTANVTVAA